MVRRLREAGPSGSRLVSGRPAERGRRAGRGSRREPTPRRARPRRQGGVPPFVPRPRAQDGVRGRLPSATPSPPPRRSSPSPWSATPTPTRSPARPPSSCSATGSTAWNCSGKPPGPAPTASRVDQAIVVGPNLACVAGAFLFGFGGLTRRRPQQPRHLRRLFPRHRLAPRRSAAPTASGRASPGVERISSVTRTPVTTRHHPLPDPAEMASSSRSCPRRWPRLLISVGALGVVLPGMAGVPAVIAGGLVFWPKTFGPLEGWLGRRYPAGPPPEPRTDPPIPPATWNAVTRPTVVRSTAEHRPSTPRRPRDEPEFPTHRGDPAGPA